MSSVTVDGWEFAYEKLGSGSPIILLHGLLMDRSMWDRQVEALRGSHRVVVVDAPGHGESPTRRVGFTLEDEADALAKFADTISLGPSVWGGHSMGGFKSLRLALAHPDRVKALVLIDTGPRGENPDLLPQYEAMLQVAKEEGISDDLAGMIAQIMMGAASLATDEGVRWTKHFASLDGDAIESSARAVFDRSDVRGRLGELRMPVLVVHGTDDVPISLEVARETASLIGDAELVEVPSGHTSPVERPDDVSNAMKAFLERIGA